MMDTLAHRGPDGEGEWIEGPVALGHKRLAIIDLESGRQPMSNEDGSIWIVFNGEIYNYVELRRELVRHHHFRTQSDTEVILHLYEELGERCLERLNGMFSFAIWDARQQRLFAARDRIGIKPFSPEPDRQGLEEYLTFQFCLGDRTLFRDIRKLEPGHYMTFRPARDQQPAVVCYWDYRYELDFHHTDEYFREQLVWLLNDSIRMQLRSDVPVGAHCSGGLDSSTVVTLAAKQFPNRFQTFTGAFREGPQYDETRYARAVADGIGALYHEVWPSAEEFVDVLPHLIYMMDEPAAGPGLFPQYCVSKLARGHVKVVLGGQGGDELFGGYARYLVAYLEQAMRGAIYGTGDDARHVVTWDSIEPSLEMLRQYRPLLQSFFKDGRHGPALLQARDAHRRRRLTLHIRRVVKRQPRADVRGVRPDLQQSVDQELFQQDDELRSQDAAASAPSGRGSNEHERVARIARAHSRSSHCRIGHHHAAGCAVSRRRLEARVP
jgi:asparagine synthase (glutamine-hydrolysing)